MPLEVSINATISTVLCVRAVILQCLPAVLDQSEVRHLGRATQWIRWNFDSVSMSHQCTGVSNRFVRSVGSLEYSDSRSIRDIVYVNLSLGGDARYVEIVCVYASTSQVRHASLFTKSEGYAMSYTI